MKAWIWTIKFQIIKSRLCWKNISFDVGRGREGTPPHSFRTSFYLFAAVQVPRRLPNLPQTVFQEESSIYNRQFLLKTGLIYLIMHVSLVSLTFAWYFFTIKARAEKLKLEILFGFRFDLRHCAESADSKPRGSEEIFHIQRSELGDFWFHIWNFVLLQIPWTCK